MFIHVTSIEGAATKDVIIGLRYIVLVEPYETTSEPEVRAIITLMGRVLNTSETCEVIQQRIDQSRGLVHEQHASVEGN